MIYHIRSREAAYAKEYRQKEKVTQEGRGVAVFIQAQAS